MKLNMTQKIKALMNKIVFAFVGRKQLNRLKQLSASHRLAPVGVKPGATKSRPRAKQAARIQASYKVGYVKGRPYAVCSTHVRAGSVSLLASLF